MRNLPSSITRPSKRTKKNTYLAIPCVCDCGMEIRTSVWEVENFETVECPRCGTDVYYEEWLLDEAKELIDELELRY